jgi:hypothetical protein
LILLFRMGGEGGQSNAAGEREKFLLSDHVGVKAM